MNEPTVTISYSELQKLRMKLASCESGWSNCSQACAHVQGERDQALAWIRNVLPLVESIAAYERRFGTVSSLLPFEYGDVLKPISEWAMGRSARALEQEAKHMLPKQKQPT